MILTTSMKKLFAPLALLAAAGLGSCSEDFELAAPYKDITVVYGMLNPADTAHYIRIQKAFLDESKSAIDMSKVADSNFYKSLRVDVKELNNGSVSAVFADISRVDMTNEGYPKGPGDFFTAPNYAYKFKANLNSSRTYRVVITNTVTGNVDSAETNVITNDSNAFLVPRFNLNNPNPYILTFSNPQPASTFDINLIKSPPNARVAEGIIRFHYVDKNTQTGVQTDQSVDWHFNEKALTDNSSVNLSALNQSFFTFLQGAIPAPAGNIERYMDSCDLFIWVANQDYINYRTASQASSGLTGDQVKPIYTNIKGKDVLGLFAARTFRSRLNVPVDANSLNLVKTRNETAFLKFVGFSDH